jgi:hypothetical protein
LGADVIQLDAHALDALVGRLRESDHGLVRHGGGVASVFRIGVGGPAFAQGPTAEDLALGSIPRRLVLCDGSDLDQRRWGDANLAVAGRGVAPCDVVGAADRRALVLGVSRGRDANGRSHAIRDGGLDDGNAARRGRVGDRVGVGFRDEQDSGLGDLLGESALAGSAAIVPRLHEAMNWLEQEVIPGTPRPYGSLFRRLRAGRTGVEAVAAEAIAPTNGPARAVTPQKPQTVVVVLSLGVASLISMLLAQKILRRRDL